MDKRKLYPSIMLGLELLLPLTAVLLSVCGYELRLHHPLLPMLVTTGMFGGAAVAALRQPCNNEKTGIYGAVVLFGVLRFFFVMYYCQMLFEMVLALVRIVLAAVVWCSKPSSSMRKFLRGLAMAVLSILVVYIGAIGFFAFQIGETTVVQEVLSPSGEYRAEVTDVDQGALGGDTVVSVSRSGSLHLYFFEIADRRERIWMGPWGAAQTLNIEWTDERKLTVNGKAYEIN